MELVKKGEFRCGVCGGGLDKHSFSELRLFNRKIYICRRCCNGSYGQAVSCKREIMKLYFPEEYAKLLETEEKMGVKEGRIAVITEDTEKGFFTYIYNA
jgi:hypothetical protein